MDGSGTINVNQQVGKTLSEEIALSISFTRGDAVLSPPVQIARWALMCHFLSVCLSQKKDTHTHRMRKEL